MAQINKPTAPLVPAEIDPAVLDGKADLVNGEVPSDQLPSYVDDVLEFASASEFPAEGEEGKIYVDLATNLTYRWSGSAYIQINEVDLSNYYTKSATDNLLAAKANSDAVTLALSTKASAADVAELQRVTHNLEAVAFDGFARQYVDGETGSWILTDLPITPGIYRINSDVWTGVYGVLLWNDDGWTCWLNQPGYEFFHGELPEPGVTEINLDFLDPLYYESGTVDDFLATKQDVISDLSTIRSGAAAGATAVQPAALNAYYTSAEVDSAIAAAIGNVLNEEF